MKPKTGSGADGAKVNRLLAALSRPDWSRWQAELEPIDLPLGHVLYEPGGKIDFMTFPTTAIVSMLYVMENGASAEIAVVGYEGLVGISIFMGGESMPSRAVVQSADLAMYAAKRQQVRYAFFSPARADKLPELQSPTPQPPQRLPE